VSINFNMTVAVEICNIGNSDEIYPLCAQSYQYELFYYTESTLPFPLPNLDNRMKGKYFKTQAHKFLNHDIIIHLDASIEVINPDFIQICIDQLLNNDVVISQHEQRKNVYEELEHIIDEMKLGNRYLLKRYVKQPLYAEYEFYKKSGMPKSYPLYNCSFFARWNSDKINTAFNDWFDYILRYSNFDQSQFAFSAWKNDLKMNVIEVKDLFIRNRHLGYNL